MKNLIIVGLFAGLTLISLSTYAQTPTPAHIKTAVARTPQTATTDLFTQTKEVAAQSISYVDGLGRVIQQIGRQASPDGNSVIQVMEYDEFGRQVKSYLPYVEGTSADFRTTAFTDLDGFYETNALGLDYIGNDKDYYFSENLLESSPIGRTLKSSSPGEAYRLGGTHEVEMKYRTNSSADAVKKLSISIDGATLTSSNYAAQALQVTEVLDQNDHKVEQFTDREGNIVLRRLHEGATLVDTYYIYDERNLLRRVIQPEGVKYLQTNGWGNADNTSFLEDWCYLYHYDDWGRLTQKQVPGGSWVYMVYDIRDRVVLTQDATQRASNEWTYTKYDVLNRPVESGLWTADQAYTQAQMQGELDTWVNASASNLNATETTSQPSNLVGTDLVLDEYQGWDGIYGSNTVTLTSGFEIKASEDGDVIINNTPPSAQPANAFPPADGSLGNLLPFTYTYYDDYDFLADPDWDTDLPAGTFDLLSTEHPLTQTMITGSKVRVLGSSRWLNSISYIDDRDRSTEIITENTVGGYDQVSTSYVNQIRGTIDQLVTTHVSDSYPTSSPLITTESYTYDHLDRQLKAYHQVGAGPNILLSQTDYDELSQFSQKSVHSENSGTTFLNTLQNTFDIRSSATELNFGANVLTIAFERETEGWYNGNIGALDITQALVGGGTEDVRYEFSYDDMNRLTSADEVQVGTTARDVQNLAYDLNGNLKSLQRYGSTNALIDDLTYTYGNGNLLDNVGDAANDTQGFTEKTGANGNTANEYTYDEHGNLTADANKGIVDIQYNHLHLPVLITMDNGDQIEYTYDAAGIKLAKTVTEGSNVNTTSYAGGAQYKDNTLDFFSSPEGRIVPNGTGYDYEYFLKDHLGNVRVVLAEDGTMVQSNQYYPYGMTWEQPSGNTPTNNYLHGGKELQTELGLDWLDFGARFYDPALGRWHSLDPLTEQMRRHSPYNYAFDNPVRFIDPDGMAPKDTKNVNAGSDVGVPGTKKVKESHRLPSGATVRPYDSDDQKKLAQDVENFVKKDNLLNSLENDDGKSLLSQAINVTSGGGDGNFTIVTKNGMTYLYEVLLFAEEATVSSNVASTTHTEGTSLETSFSSENTFGSETGVTVGTQLIGNIEQTVTYEYSQSKTETKTVDKEISTTFNYDRSHTDTHVMVRITATHPSINVGSREVTQKVATIDSIVTFESGSNPFKQ